MHAWQVGGAWAPAASAAAAAAAAAAAWQVGGAETLLLLLLDLLLLCVCQVDYHFGENRVTNSSRSFHKDGQSQIVQVS